MKTQTVETIPAARQRAEAVKAIRESIAVLSGLPTSIETHRVLVGLQDDVDVLEVVLHRQRWAERG